MSAHPCFSPETGAQLTGAGWTAGGQVRLVGRYVESDAPALDHTVAADGNGQLVSSSLPAGDAVPLEGRGDRDRRKPSRAHGDRGLHAARWLVPFFRPWNTNGPARGRP